MGYSKTVIALTQLAMVPALATAWGLPLYGQWLLLATVPTFLVAGDFGFGYAAGNRLIGEVARGDNRQARVTFQSAQAVVLCCSTALLALVMLICFLLPDRLLAVSGGMDGGGARSVLIVLCVYGVVAMQSGLFMAAMRAHGGFALSSSLDSTVQLVEGLAVIGVAISGGTPLEAALAYLIARALGVVGHIGLALRRASWLRLGFGEASRTRMSELLRPALAAMMLPLGQAGYIQGTALAVGAAAGAATVPIFTSLRTLSRVGLQFSLSVTLPILPEFTAEHARGNQAWLARVTGALTTFNALVGAAAALTLILLGNPLLEWWTRGAIAAPQAMIALTAVSLVAATVWNPLAYLLLAVNRHELFTYGFLAGAVAALALTFVLVRHLGVTGAAGAGLLFDLAMCVCGVILVRRLTGPFPVGLSTLRMLLPQRWLRGNPAASAPILGER
ncbi:lipopolysaccharide biosynthesis protein [Mycobacterium sp. DL592]|uniref:lipopolysaccharide biosynthesis protein n=1 Tax=Mycobacterium sp. DL592 TaxID=2675524 RepID=UPI00141F6276|nr:polysaccharide biosynthesis C-terminal domain-containing protein [Mycobacterium sp. DL592]